MTIDIDVSLAYDVGAAGLALLAVEAAQTKTQVVTEETLDVENAVLRHIKGESGFGRRTWARVDGPTLRLRYRANVDVSRAPVQLEGLSAAPLDELPADLIAFLRPSRFCQSDQFETFAAKEFGHLSGGKKVAAIVEWIQSKLTYAPSASDRGTTLLDTFSSRKGVCRDYAHLLCGLARASHIPARYVSAYGPSVDPQDFHAVVHVWLNNEWQLIDPSGMCPADELVLVGAGRDAADVPFMETPNEAQFIDQRVCVKRSHGRCNGN
ncbi:Transglutaminase-like enzyme, putative cysteine protease [Roseovarius litoreus]|uniref:Transglutaminase-like enzyme, putative cysteine protease n=1 Tax=Roseovarius litoreus TaxID=1155722 RepID=A0A1M7F2R7_9RHOB|nr:transglutaminase family protein [Roseovarius litoreus]SHL97967.1 Transglutaminase-like enzyme, putative cysteine protease [Roseovarius litoreus]